ncbi:transmembrane protein [Violaceomyces palustris]|uniref:Transmembrane protein n=1 Tax=Violaceomyces palustris TaxID=1673888 RepID=A0ACD0P2Z0_9BASI|nr:transmembrane protein [Violaceomyces palustris]
MKLSEQNLFLDSAMRDWVLIPILIVMILVGVLRHNVTKLIDSKPKKLSSLALREQRILTRAGALRFNHFVIPPSSFLSRRSFLIQKLSDGSYLQPKSGGGDEKEGGSDQSTPNPFDPANMDGMMDQMKKSMVMMVPQTVIMGWINFFFSGFVLIKLPFPLTLRFKLMLQRGIDTPDLDVTWVSSLSWYFLNLFGLNAIYRLLLGDDNAADGTRDMASMSGAGAVNAMQSAPGQAPDFKKLHLAERDNLELAGLDLLELSDNGGGKKNQTSSLDAKNRWVGDGIEDRVLALYGEI